MQHVISFIGRLTSSLRALNWRSPRSLLTIGAALVLIAVLIYMFSGDASQEAATGAAPRTVETIEVAAYAQTGSAVTASASVREVVLRAETAGTVKRVVAEGTRVSAGSTIAELDNDAQRAALLQAEGSLDSAKASQQKVANGTRAEEIAVAESDVARNETALQQANEALINAMRDAYADVDAALRIEVYQFVSNPRTDPQLTVVTSASQSAIDLEAGVVDIESRMAAWHRELQTVSADKLSASIAQAQSTLSVMSALLLNASKVLSSAVPTNATTQATLDSYAADIVAARASVNAAISAVTTAVTAQKNASAGLDSAKKTLALKKAGAEDTDIATAAAGVKQSQGAYGSALAAYEKTLIRARVSGTVVACSAKVGDVVNMGADICRISTSGADAGTSYALPLSAVKYTPSGAYVLVVGSDNTLSSVEVQTGLVTASSVSVTGLIGDEMVVRDVRGLKAGETVSVATQ